MITYQNNKRQNHKTQQLGQLPQIQTATPDSKQEIVPYPLPIQTLGNIQSRNRLFPSQKFIPLMVGGYAVAVLLLSIVAGRYLYGWAHDSVLASYSTQIDGEISQQHLTQASMVAANSPSITNSDSSASFTDSVANPDAVQFIIPPLNILLLGTDARPEDTETARTDTIMMLAVNLQEKMAGLLSLPRDLWVPIPHYNLTTKINMAYGIGEDRSYPGGGPQLAKDTVGSFIGRPVQYYIRVNFRGFVEIVDLIGGIDIVVPETIHDTQYPTTNYGVETFHLDKGPQHLDGEKALKYVRTRNMDDDYGRATRQQQVLRAMLDKVLRAHMIPTLIAKAPQMMYTMRSSIDTDIPMATQFEFINALRRISLSDIDVRQLVLDNRYGSETYSEEGAWILLPDPAQKRAALHQFFSPNSSTTQSNTDTVNWVRLEILNGTGQPGIAARTRDVLQSQGWQNVSIGNADRSDYGRTLIINYGVPQSVVEKVNSALALQPGGSSPLDLKQLNSINVAPIDMRIVVGRDILPIIGSQN